MNATSYRRNSNWSTRLLIGLALIIAGAAAATWALARFQPAARVLGVVAAPQPATVTPTDVEDRAAPDQVAAVQAPDAAQRVIDLEMRLARVENATQRAEGSAGRADALLIAFAARRAVDRGVALGYLEGLLVGRFGQQHRQAIATIITAAHQPVELNSLIADYEKLAPELRRGGPHDSWWTNFKRELGSMVEIHRADEPSPNAEARYQRALQRLYAGEVDQALAETMRLPGAARAGGWVARARRYVAVHRALDEIESAALLGAAASPR